MSIRALKSERYCLLNNAKRAKFAKLNLDGCSRA